MLVHETDPRKWWHPVIAEDYGITPDGMLDLRPTELAMILDHLDMKAAEARKQANV